LIFSKSPQTNHRLISFKVSGRSFPRRFFATPQGWAGLTKNNPLERVRVNLYRKSGGGWPDFP
jgi:hypothetical protein